MAEEQQVGSPTKQRTPAQAGREQLARVVVVASFMTVFGLVAMLVALAKYKAGDPATAVAEKAFNALLPVLAGWVGTVLAFYFSSASQEHTNDILDKAMARGSARPGDGTLVSEKMIAQSKILGLRDFTKDKLTPSQISVKALQDDFKIEGGVRTITRLMFVDGGVFKYLLHVGALNAFIVNPPEGSAAATFADLLKDPNVLTEISKLVVFVSVAATLADAKAALDKVSGAQDIIVTATGNPAEPVLGWMTNVDLTKALTVS
jgi:hypothetical protein